ncbi:MAG: 2-isopropylmalate synthase [Hydrogenoanaerobacterium sp.]
MKNLQKYAKRYFMPPELCLEWASKAAPAKAPLWCSVDLRDGNQALIVPMNMEEKIEFFSLLVKLGFKEIEIGFPAASDTEYEFCRALIEHRFIPEDVTIQVLTQARPHIIEKTFDAIKGAKNVIVHLYNSTSAVQREQVFAKTQDEIMQMAVDSAALMSQYAKKEAGVRFEYSPESFSGTEPEFSLKICNAVLEQWKPVPQKKVIINLPATLSCAMPHIFASQVEYISKHLKYRENVILSVHPHNDRGCAVADTELALLAGAQRVEGTLFGNGERSGNVDIITLALNLYSQGVDPYLNLEDVPKAAEVYEKVTGMRVPERQPYSGALVFAAFAGSHQDAIAKGMKWRDEHPNEHWEVPYLALDPKDIGREYGCDVIRINSQSGKGGIGYILEKNYGYRLPAEMCNDFCAFAKSISEKLQKELSASEIHHSFKDEYVNFFVPIDVTEAHFVQKDGIQAIITATINTKEHIYNGRGNGRLDAVANALKENLGLSFDLLTYEEHALERGTSSRAAAYVSIGCDGKTYWGAGVHDDIMAASVNALVSAINRSGVQIKE